MEKSSHWLLRPVATWTILAVSMLLAGMVWYLSDLAVTNRERERFNLLAEDIVYNVNRRILEYQSILYGSLGLFQASDQVTWDKWAVYVNNLTLFQHYPGIHGIGFSKIIPANNKMAHLRQTRSEGFPTYRLWPAGDRDFYTSIVFMQPFNSQNQKLLGYDMYSERVRRDAMERARDSGMPATSGLVTLSSETQVDSQTGFIIYLPYYHIIKPLDTVEQRRAALAGYIFGPFRVRDLMVGILGASMKDVTIEIYDGLQTFRHNLLYDSHQDGILHTQTQVSALFERLIPLTFGGKTWTLGIFSQPGFISPADRALPVMGAAGCVLLGVMLFITLSTLRRKEQHDFAMTRTMALEIQENQSHLQAIINTFPFLTWIKNREGRFIMVNHSFAKAAGLESASLAVGKTDAEIWPKVDALQYQSFDQQVILQGVQKSFEMVIAQDGKSLQLAITNAPFFDNNGNIIGTTGFAKDISESNQLRGALTLANRAAQNASKAKSAFLAAISHEIRTPMNSILGMGEMLANSPKLNEKEKNYLAIARRSGETLLTMINNIFDLSIMETGQLQLESLPFDPAEEARNAVHMLQESAKQKGLVLTCRLLPEIPNRILGDSQRLRQILRNLLANALKNTQQGSITLTLQPEDNETLLFTIADSGVGISAEKQAALFQPFPLSGQRLGSAGMGLAITRQLVTLMGGRLWLESIVEHGSVFRFTVRLPWLKQAPQTVNPVSSVGSQPLPFSNNQGLDILLVDDMDDNRMVIRAFLDGTPHHIQEATNGKDALEEFLKHSFDLILMDLTMPIMDGLEATRLIRAVEKHQGIPHTPIIALTASAMKEDLNNSLAAGCDQHLSKPIRRSELLAVINSLQKLK